MRTFEYYTITNGSTLTAETLNKLGALGWELVSAMHNGYGSYDYIFKKETTPAPVVVNNTLEVMQPAITEESIAKIILGVLTSINNQPA
jgi:hypothetical protein